MMRFLLPALLMALPLAARAQPVDGLYVGAGAGANFKIDEIVKDHFLTPLRANTEGFARFKTGVTAVASVGYGFGNGFRVELEGDYANNTQDRTKGVSRSGASLHGHELRYGGMVNALFDFDIGSPYVWPYAGVGAGYAELSRHTTRPSVFGPEATYDYTTGAATGQLIAGVSIPVPWVVGLSTTVEYRFVAVEDTRKDLTLAGPLAGQTVQRKVKNDFNNEVLLGLRYAFSVAPPPPPPAPTPAPAPAAQPTRSYLVFFDWDRADLSARAREVIAEAAAGIAHVAHTRIEVDGHADRSGTPAYNQRLSLRRAETVEAELVRDGVARSDIQVQAFGDTRPLVPTAAGVREAQNRRVEIIIR